jgi:GntR family transcriptional regulator
VAMRDGVTGPRPAVVQPMTRSQWLAADLRGRIIGREWPRGSRIPSETDLAAGYQVSRVTVRTALKALESHGLVDIRQGAGTFVSDFGVSIRAGLQELGSITATIRETGHDPGMECRSIEERPATALEGDRLNLGQGAPVLSIERAFLSDGEVVAYTLDVIRRDVLPKAAVSELIGFDRGSVFSIFGVLAQFGMRPKRALSRLHAVQSDEVGWGDGRPADGLYLFLDQVHFSAGSQPLMYSKTYFVEGRFEFVILRNA